MLGCRTIGQDGPLTPARYGHVRETGSYMAVPAVKIPPITAGTATPRQPSLTSPRLPPATTARTAPPAGGPGEPVRPATKVAIA
jgi:hypothetical protein